MPVKKLSALYFSFILLLITSIIGCILLRIPDKNNGDGYSFIIKSGKTIREQDAHITTGKLYFGKSGLGKNLVCYKISPPGEVKTKLLMTYEIHGFEDTTTNGLPDGQPVRDGGTLVAMANRIVRYFENHKSALGKTALYIIPSTNPDGLSDGYTKDGPGRCQVTLGIDLNRDFGCNFVTYTESRNHTLAKPFSAPESRAVRDLYDAVKPNAVIDCHGWADTFIGNGWLAGCFKTSLGVYSQRDFSSGDHGYWSLWAASQGANAMLIEYPEAAYTQPNLYADRTIEGIKTYAAQAK